MMKNLWQDIVYGFRLMLKSPGFSTIAIITLALGIGANSAIFSVVNAILIRPLPFKGVDQVVWVWGRWPGGDRGSVSPPDFQDYRKLNNMFEQFAAYLPVVYNLTDNNDPERVEGAAVSAGFFEALGISPALGRVFLLEEEQEGRGQVVILNNGLWKRRYGADAQILGKTIPIDGASFTVVGVMPENVQFPQEADLYVPMPLYLRGMQNRRANMLRPIARVKPGVSLQQAQSEVDAIALGIEKQFPDTNTGRGLRLVPLKQEILGDIRPVLIMLLSAVGFVLLISCANVANLLLARASSRQKEIAIRMSLGAKRSRIIWQLLIESTLLSLLGGALGVLLAKWGTSALVAMTPDNVPRIKEVSIDGWVLAFTFLISVATGLIFGVIPALQASRTDLNESLKEAAKGSSVGFRSGRTRSLLVIAEVALALVLLVGAGLMIKSFTRLQSVDPGFDVNNVLTMQIQLPDYKYSNTQQRANFFQQVLQGIGSLPGVKTAGMTSELPLSGQLNDAYFNVEGRPSQTNDDRGVANFRMVSAKYFQTLGISLLKGRFFTEQEESQATPVAIVNHTLMRRAFPNEEPIGKRLVIDVGEPLSCEVVGVVEDVRNYGLDEDIFQEIYIPFIGGNRTNLVVKTSVPPTNLAGPVRGVVRSIDRDQPIAGVTTVEDVVTTSIAEPRFRTHLLSIFAALALILAIVGIYGVMAYSVTQRSHEIGIRMALGATTKDVLKLIVGHALRLALIGVILGLVGAFAVTRIISNQLYNVSPIDPIVFATIPILLVAVAFVASILPARRATRVSPIIVLRSE